MKKFYVLDDISNDVCCIVHAKNEKSALKKYSGFMTFGLYEIVKENDGYKLISSYGSHFSAIPCNYDYNGFLAEIC